MWTAASGMMAQQTSVDTISNNLANVNTVGYKSESTEFKSLLYQNLQARTTSANGEFKPVSAQVGLGARVSSITSHYSTSTEGMMLCTADGYPVLSSDGQPIVVSSDEYDLTRISMDSDGNVTYKEDDGNVTPIGVKIGLFQFTNPSGLEKLGGNYLAETDASGIALNEDADAVGKKSQLKQKYLEASNVEVATEMVNLITAQRAYELCSKAITTSDTMMEQANALKR